MINSFSLFDFEIHNIFSNNIENSENSYAELEKRIRI